MRLSDTRGSAWSFLMAGLWLVSAPVQSGHGAQPHGVLRGTILDAETGVPSPCAVSIVAADGDLVLEKESYKAGFRCDGRFVKELPAGRTRIRVARGFATPAEERTIELPAGRETEVEFRLRRNVDLRQQGWYGGDSHAHMIHGERTIAVDFDDVALAAQAEDLDYFSLAYAWAMDSPTPEKLEAELRSRSTKHCALTWNLEAPKNYYRGDAGRCLGHCWTLGMRGRTADGANVIPLLLHASAHDYEVEKPSFANFESHQFIHAQGGAVFYTHPARWWTGSWGGRGGYPKRDRMRISNLAVELPLDTLIGPTFDGLDIMTGAGEFKANALAFDLWCLLLNHGYRVAATASSDACFDRPGGAIPGVVRTYTHLDEEFSWPALARATAQGRTFVSSGPLLLVSVDGQPPGSSFPAGERSYVLAIQAWASGQDPQGLTRLEVLRNGRPFWSQDWPQPRSAVQTNLTVRDGEDAWYCVRVFGSDPLRQRAMSGAFFFDTRPHQAPTPVPARVHVTLLDAESGRKVSGTVTEVAFSAARPQDGRRHEIGQGGGVVTIPGASRLRAEAAGYQPLTLSPFLDHPELLEAITSLTADDLVRWETFERVRALLGDVRLSFRLRPVQQDR